MKSICWSGVSSVLLGGCVFVSDADFNDRLDADGDGHQSMQFGGDDCDDANADIFPGAAEFCDDVDSDCDGELEDGQDAPDWFADTDGDGFGDPDRPVRACTAPAEHVADDSDCDDADGAIHPDAVEVCNDGEAVDEDCDPSTLADPEEWFPDGDGDTYGEPGSPVAVACEGPEGTASNDLDCDDEDGAVNPGVEEVCSNGIDDDCDPETVCSLSGEVPIADAGVRFYEPRAGGILGRGLAAGDADGDGDLDSFFFAQNDAEGASSGRVYVVSPAVTSEPVNLGESGGVEVLVSDIDGFAESTEFGWSLDVGSHAGVPGAALFVGAPKYESREDYEYGCNGAVFALDVDREADAWRITQADEVHYMVRAPGARLGEALAVAEDLSGSGATALLLGAPGFQRDDTEVVRCGDDAGGRDDRGALFVVESVGAGTRTTGGSLLYDAQLLAGDGGLAVLPEGGSSSLGSDTALGTSVAYGDLDGDGTDEVLGGAPGAQLEGSEVGAVLVFSTPLERGQTVGFGDADLTVFGSRAGGRLGAALAVHDVDGDGHADVVMGEPGGDGAAGAVQVLFSGPDGLPSTVALADGTVSQTTVLGADALQVGRSVAVSADLDRDGAVDLLAGGPGGVSAPGEVWGFSAVAVGVTLERADADFVYRGDEAGDLFGGRLAAPGPLGADDEDPDLLIAAPARTEGASASSGAVWWLPGVGL